MGRHTKLGVEEDFFNKLRESSRIKQRIVTDYFVAYNRVMAPGDREKVGYADLFAGPGVYTSASGETQKSIPILICESVIQNEVFRAKVHLWFNEGDRQFFEQLQTEIAGLPGIDGLRYKPTIDNKIVDGRWPAKMARPALYP